MAKTALITGATGQDGAYLARLLLEKGYEVYGTHRPSSSPDLSRLAELGVAQGLRPVPLDLLDGESVRRAIADVQPDEVYNLAAQSSVALSFEQPVHTGDADGLGVARLFEAIRAHAPHARFLQASTGEVFGGVSGVAQTEATPFHPRSPYGAAKLYAQWIVRVYREAHGMHAGSAILFNHESPLRGTGFLTRKVTATLALIHHGQAETLSLGNLDARRDWGFAGDYVEGMWSMLQAEEADDFVLATGRAETVRDFVRYAANATGFDLEWEGTGVDEVGRERTTGRTIVRVDPRFYRPVDSGVSLGDPTKAREKLGWTPSVDLEGLVVLMVRSDLDKAARGELKL